MGSCPRKDSCIRLTPATPPFPETPTTMSPQYRIFPSNGHLREASSKNLGKLGGYKLLNNVANNQEADFNPNKMLVPDFDFFNPLIESLLVNCCQANYH